VNMARPTGSCWPNQEQEMLLRAALLAGDAALHAWQQWQLGTDIDRVDAGSYRLLPKLYRNLEANGSKDPLLGRLKGVYRNTWYRNQLLFHHASNVLSSFHQAGIETLCLKGAAMVALYYRDPGLRHMEDIDVLVRPQQALDAIRLLEKSGWQSRGQYGEAWLTYEHAAEFTDNANRNLDLHWRVMWDGRPDVPDDNFWHAALKVKVGGIDTLALNASDQLLHVCVHGANWNVMPPLRWVADAMTIMQSSSRIDWDRLTEQARTRELTLVMYETLKYLRDLLDAPVPSGILEGFRDSSVSNRQKFFFQTRTSSNMALRRLPVVWHWYQTFCLPSAGSSLFGRIANLCNYFQSLWRLERSWHVPMHVMYKAMRAATHIPYWYVRDKVVRRRSALTDS
jgi:hypothetical protein